LKEISEAAALFACAWQLTCSSLGMMVIAKSHLTSPPDGGLLARRPSSKRGLVTVLSLSKSRPAIEKTSGILW
jgi:hypothetical protein